MKPTALVAASAVIALFLSSAAVACSCARLADSSFMSSAPSAPLVVHARVERHVEQRGNMFLAMDLKVVQVLRGAHDEPALRVWGDNGILCRPYVMRFPESSEWVFALHREGNEWAIGGCRQNWLRVEGGRVRGNIREKAIGEMGLSELAALLK